MKTFQPLILSGIFFLVLASLSSAPAQTSEGFPDSIDPSTLPGAKLPLFKGPQYIPLDAQGFPESAKQHMRQEVEQMRQNGFLHADEEEMLQLDRRRMKGQDPEATKKVLATLGIIPASITGTPLETAQLLDIRPNGSWFMDRWTGVSRLFLVNGLDLVALDEDDFILSGGGVGVAEELCNEMIHGQPAALRVKQSFSKRGMTELTWVTENKVFTLSVNRAFRNRKAIDELIQLAETIQ